MKLTDFNTLTFDVVGTLIDFETGMLEWLLPHFRAHVPKITETELLVAFAEAEAILQRDRPKLPFTAMLPEIYEMMAMKWKLPKSEEHSKAFKNSIRAWPPFPDSIKALRYLIQYYRLVAVTNADNWAIEVMSKRLHNLFDTKITAEDVGLNKPSPKVFEFVLDQLAPMGIEKKDILHVAQSQFHDIVPAKELGFATMWIQRRHKQEGWGATPPPADMSTPNFMATSMAEFVEQHKTALTN